MDKESLSLMMELLAQVRVSPTDPNADEIWARVTSARNQAARAISEIEDMEDGGRSVGRGEARAADVMRSMGVKVADE